MQLYCGQKMANRIQQYRPNFKSGRMDGLLCMHVYNDSVTVHHFKHVRVQLAARFMVA